ncbi:MAG: lytic transglycosylase domain-containing protein [bacterium]
MPDQNKPQQDPYSIMQSYVKTAAEEYGVPESLINAVIHSESSFNPEAESPTGAVGLMQLMPETAKSLGVTDPLDPIQNIRAGAKYLGQLLKRFGSTDLALAAYHEGPTKVAKLGRVPRRAATKQYISKVKGLSAAPSKLRDLYKRSSTQ